MAQVRSSFEIPTWISIHTLEIYKPTWKRVGPIRSPSRTLLPSGRNSIELLILRRWYRTRVSAPHHNLIRRMAVTQLSLPLHLQDACQSLDPPRASPPSPCGSYYPHPLPHVSKGKLSSSHTCLPPETPWILETTSNQFFNTASRMVQSRLIPFRGRSTPILKASSRLLAMVLNQKLHYLQSFRKSSTSLVHLIAEAERILG